MTNAEGGGRTRGATSIDPDKQTRALISPSSTKYLCRALRAGPLQRDVQQIFAPTILVFGLFSRSILQILLPLKILWKFWFNFLTIEPIQRLLWGSWAVKQTQAAIHGVKHQLHLKQIGSSMIFYNYIILCMMWFYLWILLVRMKLTVWIFLIVV